MNAARRWTLASFATDVVPAVLPDQLPSRLSRTEGCYRLVASVLETAIDDCIHRAHRREGKEAEQWIFAADALSPLPFPLVCDVLDIDVEGLRRRIRLWQTLGRRPGRLTDALE